MTDLVVGVVGRPHGLDGSFHVIDATPGLLEVGRRLRVGEAEAEVVGRKGTDEHPILRLDAAADRSAADALRGAELTVARAQAPTLAEDEYWAEDLVGCAVVAGDRVLGEVGRMVGYPSCEVLEVGDLLVPFVRDAIVSVDLESRRIEIDAVFLGL